MQNDPYTPSRLGVLRERIDALDDALLDLIEQRLAASLEVATLKADEGDVWLRLRPRREASIVARLSARARLATPRLISHVWRNLMSHSLQAQAPMELVIYAPRNAEPLHAQVRERFGWAAPLSWANTPEEAVAFAAAREAVAIVEHDPASGWWAALDGKGPVRIFDSARAPDGGIRALILGRIASDDVPEDQRFVVVREDALDGGLRPIAASGPHRLCIALAPDAANPQEARQ